ncbi:hypothetical protein [Kitasatospora sp. NPDC047058]|uniref:hypothetical protein n=1 Tax=Kitasatospora sp. NPDC047058 TaxID=3155620 RepID=UPI00340E9F8A
MTLRMESLPVRRGPAVLRGLAVTGVVGLGFAAAAGTYLLTWAARAYCDAGFEPAGRFEMNMLALPLTGASVLLAVVSWAGARAATRRMAIGWRGALPASVVVGSLLLLGWAYFAVVGTMDSYHGDSGLCPASNIPPWWPSFLPA